MIVELTISSMMMKFSPFVKIRVRESRESKASLETQEVIQSRERETNYRAEISRIQVEIDR